VRAISAALLLSEPPRRADERPPEACQGDPHLGHILRYIYLMIESEQALALEVIGPGRRGSARSRRPSSRSSSWPRLPERPCSGTGAVVGCSATCRLGPSYRDRAEPASLFNEAVIERHVATPCQVTPFVRRTSGPTFALSQEHQDAALAGPVRSGGRPAAPYSPEEIEATSPLPGARSPPGAGRWKRCLPRARGRPRRVDMRYVTGRHVTARSGGLVIDVEGTRARSCPCSVGIRRCWRVRRVSGDSYLVGGVARRERTSRLPCSPGQVRRRPEASFCLETALDLARRAPGALGLNGLLAAAGLRSSQRLFDLAGSVPLERVRARGPPRRIELSSAFPLESVLVDSGVPRCWTRHCRLPVHGDSSGPTPSLSESCCRSPPPRWHTSRLVTGLCDLPISDQLRLV